MKLDLGCGNNKHEGFIGIDKVKYPCVDIVYDLNNLPYPFKDDSVDEIIAHNILEHLECPYRAVKEWIRISKHRAMWSVRFPNPNHPNAWRDPDHKYILSPEFFTRFEELKIIKVEKHLIPAPRLFGIIPRRFLFGLVPKYTFDEWRLKIMVWKR